MTRAPAALGLAAALAAAAAAVACGEAPDPCEGSTGTCLAVTVTQQGGGRIDQLELDILYGDLHDAVTTAAEGAVELPVTTAIRLGVPSPGPEIAAIVVAAKLGGAVIGTGAASPELPPGGRASVEIALAPPEDCVAGSFYCGGDRLAGDPGVLYVCNAGGVPFARGRCASECVVNVSNDDACRGVGGPCVEGGFYCGGNKLDGDPRSLYRCVGGVGRDRRDCANGCAIRPPGQDDACR